MTDLLSDFPPVTTAAWEAQIAKDLKGRDPRTLIWETEDGIAVKPFYRAEDTASLVLPDSPLAGRSWHIGCEITSAAGIELALEHGAQAVQVAPELVDNLPLDRVAVYVDADPTDRFAAVSGCFTIDPTNLSPELAKSHLERARTAAPGMSPFQIDAVRFHQGGASVTQELALAMAAGADSLDMCGEVDDLQFSFAIGSNYFFEIAKLRAARQMWKQIYSSFFPGKASEIRIRANTSRWNKTVYDPHNNLLRATTEAMAAVLGGCETLMVGRFDDPYAPANEFSQRLALNTQLILRDEAYFGRVHDPAAGCWYIESLTDSVARAAWRIFQEIERQGGIRKADWPSLVAPVAAKRKSDIAKRKRAIIGVNQYANPKERAPGEFTNSRGAYPFEALRLRMERAPRRRSVLLARMGDAKMRRARAEFCANYFACAGFEVLDQTGLETTEADLVVLCSSDAEYPELARTYCRQLKQPVLVAGYPKELVPALEAAGIADFVYLGSDAVEKLSRWMQKLGVE